MYDTLCTEASNGGKALEIGKIPSEMLQGILEEATKKTHEDILMGPGLGMDCGIINCGEWACSVSSDPITGACARQGYIGMHVSCNDIAASGAKPIAATMTILLPENSDLSVIHVIMRDALLAADELNVAIIGGHTEVTDAVTRPIISVTAIGRIEREHILYPQNIKADQVVVLTKMAGLEGTAILAADGEDYLLRKGMSQEAVLQAKELLKEISVVKESQIAMECGAVYMHDVTEGGILGALWEVAEAADSGIRVFSDLVPVNAITQRICNIFEICPLRLISSGSMLIVIARESADALIARLSEQEILACVIAEITDEKRRVLDINGLEKDICAPEADHLFIGLEKAVAL